jgi:hypothetical protein
MNAVGDHLDAGGSYRAETSCVTLAGNGREPIESDSRGSFSCYGSPALRRRGGAAGLGVPQAMTPEEKPVAQHR